jgi:hypothetical protein
VQAAFSARDRRESEKALLTAPDPVELAVPRLAALSGLIATSVAANPADRPASAEQLARPLREFLKSADLGDIARRLGERVRKTRRRSQHSTPWLVGEGIVGGARHTAHAAGSRNSQKSSCRHSARIGRSGAAGDAHFRRARGMDAQAAERAAPGPSPAQDTAEASQPGPGSTQPTLLEVSSSPAVSIRPSTGPRPRHDDDASRSPRRDLRPIPRGRPAAGVWLRCCSRAW